MRLSNLAIRAFRSLYQVDLEVGPFVVLTGPNNSGKTNIAESFDFLRDVHRHGLESAVIRKGGFENIAHRRMRRTRHGISFHLTVDVDLQSGPIQQTLRMRRQEKTEFEKLAPSVRVEHSFELRAAAGRMGSDFSVHSERIVLSGSLRQSSPNELVRLERTGDQVAISRSEISNESIWAQVVDTITDSGFGRYVEHNLSPVALAFAQLTFFNRFLRSVEILLSRMNVFQLSPPEARRSGTPTPNPELERHGSNLPALVRHMQMNDADAWSSVFDAMLRIVPTLKAIQWDFTSDLRLTLKFVEKGVGRAWSSQEISDGTIQSLAMFCALYDRRSPLTIIEEPENSVHPWIIRTFVDVCREVPEKQIILTTHSPALLNYVTPSEVMIVWRQEGQTQVKSLSSLEPDAEALWVSGASRLFDIIDSGWLSQTRPEGFR